MSRAIFARLGLALFACTIGLAVAAPAAAVVHIDPGRLLAQHPAMTSAPTVTSTAAIAPAALAVYRLAPMAVISPSLIGDRPADGTQSCAIGYTTDLGSFGGDFFNLNLAIGGGSS